MLPFSSTRFSTTSSPHVYFTPSPALREIGPCGSAARSGLVYTPSAPACGRRSTNHARHGPRDLHLTSSILGPSLRSRRLGARCSRRRTTFPHIKHNAVPPVFSRRRGGSPSDQGA